MTFTAADMRVARALADRLMQTCQPSEYWDAIEELTQAQCLALDSIVFECKTCNHWFPVAERREAFGQFYCKDCVE